MKRTNFLILIMLLVSVSTFAQQQSMFTKYMFNTLAFNPAYAGSREALSGNLLYRNQWMGLEGAPVTQTLGIHSPIKPRVAVGLIIVNDKIGPTSSTSVNAIYAYRMEFGKGKLAIGFQAGALNWRADWDKLRYRDPQTIDDAFSGGNESKWFPNFGAGIYYNSEHFYTGFATPGLLENSLNTGSSYDLSAKLYRHYYYSIGGAIPISGDMIVFKPSALLKGVNVFSSGKETANKVSAPIEFDIDFGFLFYDTFWLGTSFRSSVEKFTNKSSSYDSADIWTSFQLRNGLRIGAAYDYSLTKIQTVSKGSVELMVGYDFNYHDAALSHVRYF